MDNFKAKLEKYFANFFEIVSTDTGEWTVKGFIDIYQNIYTISIDTKVISKLIELMIFPIFPLFASENNYSMILSAHQNHYPDISFVHNSTGKKIALDIKSTYRTSSTSVNGMTLGAFTGYFRNRVSSKNITFPYSQYEKHYVLGIIYSRTDIFNAEKCLIELGINLNGAQRKKLIIYISTLSDEYLDDFAKCINWKNDTMVLKEKIGQCIIDEKRKYKLTDLKNILSVVRDFDFFIQEKWRIAIDRPGSGNTKNIGSSTVIKELKDGKALFTKLENGESLFRDYWMNYLTKDMAMAIGMEKPYYNNIFSYMEYKKIK
jgi:hypothetical protein